MKLLKCTKFVAIILLTSSINIAEFAYAVEKVKSNKLQEIELLCEGALSTSTQYEGGALFEKFGHGKTKEAYIKISEKILPNSNERIWSFSYNDDFWSSMSINSADRAKYNEDNKISDENNKLYVTEATIEGSYTNINRKNDKVKEKWDIYRSIKISRLNGKFNYTKIEKQELANGTIFTDFYNHEGTCKSKKSAQKF